MKQWLIGLALGLCSLLVFMALLLLGAEDIVFWGCLSMSYSQESLLAQYLGMRMMPELRIHA